MKLVSWGSRQSLPIRYHPAVPLIICLLLGLFAAALLLIPSPIKPVRRVLANAEWLTYDVRMRYRPLQPLNQSLIAVGLSNLDYLLYGEELYNREEYLLLLQALQRLGIKAIIFDILFDHPRIYDEMIAFKFNELDSYISYKFLTEPLPVEQLTAQSGVTIEPELKDIKAVPQVERSIEKALQERSILQERRIQALERGDEAEVARIDGALQLVKFRLTNLKELYMKNLYRLSISEGDWTQLYQAQEVILPSAVLLTNARGFGFINVEKGEEEVIRRIPLIYEYKGSIYPQLDLVFLCDYYGVDVKAIKVKPGEYIEFKPTKNYNATKRIPIDKKGNCLVNFREGESFLNRGYTIGQLLHYEKYKGEFATRIDPKKFKDAIVIVGESMVGGTDTQPIPIQPLAPMVLVHANLLNNVLNDDYLKVLPQRAEIAIVLAIGLMLGLLFPLLDHKRASWIAWGVLIIYSLLAIMLFNNSNLVLPVIKPLLTFVLGFIMITFYVLGVKERERRKVRSVFFKTVSPEIGQEILNQYDSQAIWGMSKKATILFVDIRGFTPLAQQLSASQVVSLLNSYYDLVSDIIFRQGGQINKFMGDGIMALFGAPLSNEQDEATAIISAIEIQTKLKQLNQDAFQKELNCEIEVGIGINTGEVVVGTVGGESTRIEYTALGDNVNIAERLERLAGRGQILVGQTTYELAQKTHKNHFEDNNVTFCLLPQAPLKGIQKTVSVYKVIYQPPED